MEAASCSYCAGKRRVGMTFAGPLWCPVCCKREDALERVARAAREACLDPTEANAVALMDAVRALDALQVRGP